MIQRLQSIFLLLASGSLGATYAFSYADTETAVAGTPFADQLLNVHDSVVLLIAIVVAAVVFFAAIFLYNNRKLQSKVVMLGIASAALGLGVVVGQFLKVSDELGTVAVDDGPSLYTNIAGLILGALGIRYINKDEKLVRSADRLR